ncbi:MAG: translation initiation factor IF-2 subunit beta [archaeon]
MNYEDMLDSAYENVEVNEVYSERDSGDIDCSGRFEILKVKGHHEGVRTIISNFLQVAICLRRKPEHLLKFLGKELGIQGEIRGDQLVVSRKLSSKDINVKIGKYARQYVICAKCGKPDTELDNEGGKFFVRCLACGNKGEVHKI